MTLAELVSGIEPDLRPVLMPKQCKEMDRTIAALVSTGQTVRVIRGRKMRSLSSLFDEVAASLQFPHYFGENKDAMDDCLQDLSWLAVDRGIVLIVTDADQVLVESADDLEWLRGALSVAAAYWGAPVRDGQWWDRPAVPFHLVLVSEPHLADTATSRWRGAGANVLLV